VSSILAKLGLADRTRAAIFGLQQRLVPLDQALDEEKRRRPAWAGRPTADRFTRARSV